MTVVVVVPVLSVERPQLREAWRCLVGQGWDKTRMSDDVVAGLLWRARALPVVVDVLSGLDLFEVRLEAAVVDVLVPGAHVSARAALQGRTGSAFAAGHPRDPGLALLAWRRDDELCVEVLVAPRDSIDEGSVVDAAVVRMAFPFRLVRVSGEEDITAEDMKIGRPRPVDNASSDNASPNDDAADDAPDNVEPVRVRRFSLGKTT